MWAIFKREVKSFFLTPIGYIYMGIFLLLSGLFFVFTILPQNPYVLPTANYNEVIGTMVFTLLFLGPILTMKLITDEKRTGTDQLLFTSPVSLTGIILGKYLAAVFIFASISAVTLIYPLILSRFAEMDINVVMAGYLGYFLIGASFIAVGIFASSVTQNQIVAAIMSFCLLLFLWLAESVKFMFNLDEKGQKIADYFLVYNRFDEFLMGIIDIDSIIFYLGMIAVFLFLTFRSIEKRRWSKG